MKLDDLLLLDPALRAYAAMPEVDPLTEEDSTAHQEASGTLRVINWYFTQCRHRVRLAMIMFS